MFGAIFGDIVGSRFEYNRCKDANFNLLSTEYCSCTNDSIMTLAVAEIVQNKWYTDKDKVIDTLKKWGHAYPNRGYGKSFYEWLFSDEKEPYSSFGNESATRVSSVGWYANSEEEVKHISRLVTEVTHSHQEAIKGAEVVAMCIYYARKGMSKEFIENYVQTYYNMNYDYEDLLENYYYDVTCQGTVPQAIFCFLISNSFEDCIRKTIMIGGDSDSLLAISGAIAEAYYKDFDDDNVTDQISPFIPSYKDECNPCKVLLDFYRHKEELKK